MRREHDLTVSIDSIEPRHDDRHLVTVTGSVNGRPATHHTLVVNLAVNGHTFECRLGHRRPGRLRRWSVDVPMVGPATHDTVISVVAHADHHVARCDRVLDRSVHPTDDVHGHLDLDPDGTVVTNDVLSVFGWCLFGHGTTARVDVYVDDTFVGNARPFVDRHDLNRHGTHRDAPVGGFHMKVPLRQFPVDQPLTVRVVAHAMDGRTWESASAIARRSPSHTPQQFVDYAETLRQRIQSRRGGTTTTPARPRVAVVTHDLGYGGGQLWLSDMLQHFLESDHFDTMVFSLADGPLRADLERLGIPVMVTEQPVVKTLNGHLDRVAAWADTFSAHGANAVVVNTLSPFQAVHAAHALGLPTIWAIHESFDPDVYCDTVWGTAMDPTVRADFARTLSLPEALVFEARETAALFRDWSAPHVRRILDYSVDIDAIDTHRARFDRTAARQELGWDDDHVVIAVVGVFEPRKAHGAMVAVFDELTDAHPEARLLLVGAHGSWYSEAVREQVRRARHPERIHVQPITPDIADWYAVSDLLVCAADIESLPRSILEAMAFHLPVVSTDVFGVASLLDDGTTGWLSPVGDFRALAATLHRVLRAGPAVWKGVAAAARHEVERRTARCRYGEVLAESVCRLMSDRSDPLADLPLHEHESACSPRSSR